MFSEVLSFKFLAFRYLKNPTYLLPSPSYYLLTLPTNLFTNNTHNSTHFTTILIKSKHFYSANKNCSERVFSSFIPSTNHPPHSSTPSTHHTSPYKPIDLTTHFSPITAHSPQQLPTTQHTQMVLAEDASCVNDRGKNYTTPLMEAAEQGHYDIMRLLIHYNADVHAHSKSGTPAHLHPCLYRFPNYF